MEVTSSEVAARLGVSLRQAQRLARSGRLQVVRQIGTSKLLDDSGIAAASYAKRGRVWAPHTAWAAIDLLEAGSTQRLAGSSLSRLRGRLRDCDATEFVRLTSRRAVLWRGAQTRRSADQLRSEIALSGESLLARGQVAKQFGLVAIDAGRTEGYAHADDWERLRSRFGLEADAEGLIVIHRSAQEPTTGVVSTALDLAERWAVRERSAALEFLGDLLAQ